MDVRPGGAWNATMYSGPSHFEIHWKGEYREVDPPERLVFTVSDRSDDRYEVVRVVLTDLGDGRTEMHFEQRGHLRPEQYERTRQGWGTFFDRIAERLAQLSPERMLADEGLASFVSRPGPAMAAVVVAQLRAQSAERARTRAPGPALHPVTVIDVAGRPARLYRPAPGPVPLVVYLHGGGWIIGSLDASDRVCRRLAAGSGAAVLALDYRLAPEHPWPASVDDTVAALEWVAGRPAPLEPVTGRVAVAGDSAGSTLAALACLRLRATRPAALPDLQVLLYPNTDLTGASPSMRENATGFGLTADDVRTFARYWVPDESRWGDPGVSPLHAPDLTGLPAALIVTAEYDPLRDEGEAYARRLADAGVDVELRREPGLIHNFLMLDELSPASAAAADHVAAELGERLTR
jgi:acetyl esterase